MIAKADVTNGFQTHKPRRSGLTALIVVMTATVSVHVAAPGPQDSPVPKPVVENAPANATVTSEAYEPAADRPFGIGRITIPLKADDDWQWYRDQPACVRNSGGKISDQAFEFQPPKNDLCGGAFSQ